MKAIDFIIHSLKNISKNILGISLKYAYDSTTDFHIVEVSPENIRRGNKEYEQMEYQIWKEFLKLYPDEDLIIGEVDESNNMSNLLYESTTTKNRKMDLYKYNKMKENNSFDEYSEYQLAA